MNEVLLGLAIGFCGFAWTELREWLPYLARKLIGLAVRALPSDLQARMREELLAELNSVPGKLSPMIFAISVWIGYKQQALNLRLASRARSSDLIFVFLYGICAAPTLIAIAVVSVLLHRRVLTAEQFIGKSGVPFVVYSFPIGIQPQGLLQEIWHLTLTRTRFHRLPALYNLMSGDVSLKGPSAIPVTATYRRGRELSEPPSLGSIFHSPPASPISYRTLTTLGWAAHKLVNLVRNRIRRLARRSARRGGSSLK